RRMPTDCSGSSESTASTSSPLPCATSTAAPARTSRMLVCPGTGANASSAGSSSAFNQIVPIPVPLPGPARPDESPGAVPRAPCSVPRRLSILARFAGARPAAVRVGLDRLVAAVGAVGEAHAVALAHQRAHGLVGEAGFQFDAAAVGHGHGLPGRLGGAVVLDARRV